MKRLITVLIVLISLAACAGTSTGVEGHHVANLYAADFIIDGSGERAQLLKSRVNDLSARLSDCGTSGFSLTLEDFMEAAGDKVQWAKLDGGEKLLLRRRLERTEDYLAGTYGRGVLSPEACGQVLGFLGSLQAHADRVLSG